MGQLTISIPDKLESKLRAYCENRGQTISSLVADVIREKLEAIPSPTYWERVALVMQLKNNRLCNSIGQHIGGEDWEKEKTRKDDWELSHALEVLTNGFVDKYEEIFRNEIPPNELSKFRSNYVIEVLTMYENLQQSAYETKNEDVISLVKFPGFDGNKEADLASFARYLQKHNQFQHIISDSDDMNSHGLEPNYRPMLIQYQTILNSKSDQYEPLTVDEIYRIRGK